MVATTFVEYDGTSNPSYLASSILGQGSGIQIVAGSVALSASAPTAVSLYDGSLTALGIGSGLLLTSGMVPGTSNTVGWFGSDNTQYAADGTSLNFYNGDPAIDAVVNTVFQTQSYDATMLSFDFTITDPAATSISFDIVFGSDEYPEWVDQFVDCAVIIVNGVNYAFFNHDPNAPLSVIGPNLAAGYFQDNAGNTLPIEYDGVSHVLRIVAPIRPGEVNSIKIGVADTGDHVYDSGIFISNMTAGTTPGSGVVLTPDVPCTGGDDIVSGTVADELIELLGGNDTAYAGGGDDIVVGGAGNDTIYGGSGNDVLEGGAGDDYLDGGEGLANEAAYTGSSTNYGVSFDAVTGKYALTGAEGSDTLTNIQLVKFADGLFDLGHDGLTLHSAVSGPVPNHAGSVVLSGAAMVGQTLVALVIDADGLPAPGEPISFDWLVSANGITWTDTGITANTYTLSNADAGLMVKAVVSYIDAVGQFEAPESAAVSVATANTTLTMALMELAAPDGAGVQNPLTTLLANAMALGFTANQAQTAIKAVLGLPSVNLGTYDPLAVLASQPTDTTALAVMKACAAVAMTVSVADPTGFNLTLAVMEAASQGQALDLADPAQLAAVLAGVDVATVDTIQNLNRDMANATSLNGKDGIAAVWNDFCGKVDNLAAYMGVVEVINLHLNLGPVGNSSVELPFGSEGASYTIDGSALLAGFSDPDGEPLVVSDLTTDPAAGGLLVDNGDGTWTFTPDPGFLGPVELSFIVSDPSGAGVAGSTLLVIAPPMPLDSTAPTVTIEDDAAGIANGDVTYTLTFSEDVTGLVPDAFMVTNGTVTAISGAGATYTVVVTPNSGFEGTLGLALNAGAVVDASGNANDATVAMVQAIDTKAPVVGSMTYGQNDGTLKAGESVTLSVTLSEAALVSAQASIALANGGTASYVSGSGTNTLTFSYTVATGQDTGDLASALSGALTGTITDAAGNGVDAAGFNNVNPAGSLVVDTTAPLVASFSPTDGATGVAIGANLVLTFAEAIARGTGTITLRSGSATGAIVESFDAATSSRISLSGQTLTIDPISNLANNTRYFVVFSAGTVTDVAGNTFAGTSTYDFTTVVAGNVMNGTANADTLTGTAAVDIISGLGGNDVITGAGGIDVLNGGDGSDLYIVGTATDHGAAEFADTGVSGTDEVRFTSSTSGTTLTLYAADSGIEKVAIGTGTASAAVATGTTALNLNAAALTSGVALVGNAGANVLTSGGGNDTLTGNGGVDTFIVTAGTDTVTDLGNGGADILNVAAGATINATVNTAWTASSSTVNKGAVAITTNGLAVNLAAITSSAVGNRGYTITNVGAAATLTGSALADQLTGGGFNDVLVGGGGIDVLNGGNGGDIYLLATTTDHGAAEFADTGVSGTDEVRFVSSTAGATLTLYAGDSGIEKVAIGTGTASAAVATGTTALNVNAAAVAEGIMLVGNAGTNVLTGGSGNDTLRGEAGNDTLNGGAGFDYADYSTATASITANLAWTTVQNTGGAGNDMLNGIEGLIGGSAADKLTGNGLDNILWGNAGNDILSGGDGADQLRGGNGSDTLTGGNGIDWFIFDTAPNASLNKDVITDFAAGTDELQFSKAAFTALAGAASGDLASDAFWAGAGVATAHDATDRFIYNTATGALYYDADGTGSAAAVQIALLGTAIHPMLAYTDMSVIA